MLTSKRGDLLNLGRGDVPGKDAAYPHALSVRFGGRDHTTVLHAVRRIEALKAEDAALARDLDVLLRKLRG